jgi:hypothetical protein
MCMMLVLLKFSWDDQVLYAKFMHIGLSMEWSNLFMNLRKYMKKDSTLGTVNDLLFVFSWFGCRVFYSLPQAILLMRASGVSGAIVNTAVYGLSVLHVYWGFLILRKFIWRVFVITAKPKSTEVDKKKS